MKSATPAARLIDGMRAVAPAAWDALANPPGARVNPFVSHAFLSALEESGSATAETGWQPTHVLVEQSGALIAAAPMYAKSHSYGEYVFDHGWAEAFERAGGRYYPKLQVCVPFTPATGPRLLTGGNANARAPLANALMTFAAKLGVSSVHITFAEQDEAETLAPLGFLQRHDQQFHWHNENYPDFAAFLTALSSIKRKNLRRERAEALKNDIPSNGSPAAILRKRTGTLSSSSTWTPARANGARPTSRANFSASPMHRWPTEFCSSWPNATAATSRAL